MVLSVRVVWNNVFVSPVVDTVSGVARTLLSEVVDLFATGVESFENIKTTFVVLTVQGKRVVTSVQVVVWIGDFSAIVEVWVDVDSVAFIS
jgi:predicted ester cyclase